VPGRVAALLDLLVVAGDVSTAIVRKWSSLVVSTTRSDFYIQNSRQNSVVLQFVFQGGKALDDGLALFGLLGVLFSRNSLVHIIDGAGLESVS
jgi:hypothetical protein